MHVPRSPLPGARPGACRLAGAGRGGLRTIRCGPTLAALVLLGAIAGAAGISRPVQAAETNVAVAANFAEAAREIARRFEAATGHRAILSFGSTGQLFTQIAQEAPFEVLLSADEERPRRAIEQGLAVAESRFTYAIGRLALYGRDPGVAAGEEALRAGRFEKIAIANPATAPYGAAAIEAMRRLGVHDALARKIVQGNDVGQAYQFVETGNAELGFVALSQIAARPGGSRWIVPAALHAPIRQDAVLLSRGARSEAARAFLEFLRTPGARAVLEQYGYGPGE